MPGTDLPRGTVTFLFTDVEGSTRLLQEHGDGYAELLAEHRRVLRDAFAQHGGVEVDTQGDAFFVAFARASDALAAARAAQEALAGGPVRVRMGLHTGEPIVTDEGYVGIDVHRAARIAAAAHGRQVLLSQATRDLVDAEVRDLGEHRLKDLSAPERIYQLGGAEFPRLKTLHQTNLPVQPGPLIGRERELNEITAFIRGGTPLLTLTGAGGSGKTRLALHAAGELADEFPDGVWFVPLSATTDPTLVESAIAQVVGAPADLVTYLRDRELLLVLDNLEQLLPDASALVAALPARTLVTSRERLAVSAEQEYEVSPLPLGDGVALFVECARRLVPTFDADEHVGTIVRRLDGLPLAVELAAARVKVLTPEQIAERLGHSLDLLTGGARDTPARQRTLRATIEWSYELLGENERSLFSRLAIFAGGFGLTAAEHVVDSDLDTLQSLVDKSLLRHAADGRFFMLATIREFALERLDGRPDEEDVRRRHAEYYVELSRAATASGGAAMDRAARDVDNLRAAVEWAEACGDVDLIARAALAAGGMRLPMPEGAGWLDAALRAADRLDASVRLDTLRLASSLRYALGDFERSLSLADQAHEVARGLHDEWAETHALRLAGTALLAVGHVDSARGRYEESLELAERGHDVYGVVRALHALGELERHCGRLAEADQLLNRAVTLARESGDPGSVLAHALCGLGESAFAAGDYERATTWYRDALVEADRVGNRRSTVYALAGLAASAAATGSVERAGLLWGAVAVQQELLGIRLLDYDRGAYDETLAGVAGPAFAAGVERGRSLEYAQVLDAALSVH